MKKILVFTSDGAGGHTATTNAIKAHFAGIYDVQAINMFRDVIGQLDVIKTVTFGKKTGEQFYEQCMMKKYFKFLNALHYVGKWYFRQCKFRTSSLIQKALKEHKPDLIISVIPLVDGAIIDASHTLNIPFLLIPTDLDSTNYIHDIHAPTYNKMHVALPFNDTQIHKLLDPAKIASPQVSVTGFPIRADFFEEKDIFAIKLAYDVPHNKKVIFLLMGSVGSDALYLYAQKLAQLSFSVHLIICVGRYKAMKEKIKSLTFPPHITVTIIDFVNKISDIMAISDLMITKAGPVTISEAMYMNLPMLIDVTSSCLAWEKFNYEFIKNHNFGNVIEDINELCSKVTQLLDKGEITRLKNNLVAYEKKHGGNEVSKIIASMLES